MAFNGMEEDMPPIAENPWVSVIDDDENGVLSSEEEIQEKDDDTVTANQDINNTQSMFTTPQENEIIRRHQQLQQPSIDLKDKKLIFGICVVDFHHTRGPEIEYWIDSNTTPETSQASQIAKFTKIWPNLPFQSLPDGAHLFEETFSNFTLLYDPKSVEVNSKKNDDDSNNTVNEENEMTTLFGCACIRQLESAELLHRKEDQTRSIVQKSVVIISSYPITIQLREKLSIITKSFFEQRDFDDKLIIKQLFDNVNILYNNNGIIFQEEKDDSMPSSIATNPANNNGKSIGILHESDFYMGLNLKELILNYKRDLLIIFKALMLEKRILIFSKNLLKLSNYQFSILSLIPNLMLNLHDCGASNLENLSKNLTKPSSVSLSNRNSKLKFLGLPLQIFNKGGFFQPYLVLQQLDYLYDEETKWYMIGTSNGLLLDQKNKIADLIVYIDHPQGKNSIEIVDKDLEKKLSLTSQDKFFIDEIIKQVERNSNGNEFGIESDTTVAELNKDKIISSSAMYLDSIVDDYIRNNFENYLVGMLSSVKYDYFLSNANQTQLQSLNSDNTNGFRAPKDNMKPNHISYFNLNFINEWKQTTNFRIFNESSYDEIFNMQGQFEPVHVGLLLHNSSNSGNSNFFNNFYTSQKEKFSKTIVDLKQKREFYHQQQHLHAQAQAQAQAQLKDHEQGGKVKEEKQDFSDSEAAVPIELIDNEDLSSTTTAESNSADKNSTASNTKNFLNGWTSWSQLKKSQINKEDNNNNLQ
ncbi:hypothetical protein PACTADRAFT_47750 [Pachysolen tannophilus NRRL Y-2460]|uniref:UDENN domain-containing protein n=1 Tax=Pachysolen tannophilus NRRL Y-2460 TaxID=669874 RepID=A0A1E4U1Q4_PACTA|nr:hypothetical protein PACTADRAFT_47750 [Pachysolen tannophilus NRRL Y-2460]